MIMEIFVLYNQPMAKCSSKTNSTTKGGTLVVENLFPK